MKKLLLMSIAAVAAACTLRAERMQTVCRDDTVIEIDAGDDQEMVAWAKNTLLPVVTDWYPRIARMLRSPGYGAPKRVSIRFIEGDGVAWTVGDAITLNTRWARGELNREAPGAIVHELAHVVQAYGRNGRKGPPGWVTEGVADWVRWMNYEKQSVRDSIYAAAKGHRYDESYRPTAAFLDFCERRYSRAGGRNGNARNGNARNGGNARGGNNARGGFVARLNAAAREGTYSDDFWTQNCGGRTLAEVAEQWQASYGAAAAASASAARPAAGQPAAAYDAKAAWESFVAAYWMPERSLFRRHRGREKLFDFWFAAHAWDTIIDAAELFGDEKSKSMIASFYDAFMRREPDWRRNNFNDDILWWTIACTRAYSATKDKRYLDQGRTMFDWLLEHEVDDTLGGGMWWKNSEHKSKNACNEFPAVITACNLYNITKDRKYLKAAVDLYAWGRKALFVESTGAVNDNMNLDGRVANWVLSYNTGTFIGSAIRLYTITKERRYLEDAYKAADHLTGAQSPNGILRGAGAGQGDGGAFNGIGARYLGEFAAMKEGAKYREWIERNAASAWAHRRQSDGLVGVDWARTPADDFDIEGQTANSAVTLINMAESLRRKK